MSDYERTYVARRPPSRKPTRKRTEGDIQVKCCEYLAELGMIVMRTNAGAIEVAPDRWFHGVPEGYADVHACTPHGCYLALETKAPKKGLRPKQAEYRDRVKSNAGVYIVAHSVAELRDELCKAYGAQRVGAWESEARARKQAKAELRDALMKRNGQKR